MSVGTLFQIAGIGLQAIGLYIAARGFGETYSEHRSTEAGFWSFLTEPSRRRLDAARRWLVALVRRVLRRPQPPIVITGSASLSFGAEFRGRGVAGFVPLETDDVAGALRELERRIDDVNRRAHRDTGLVDDKVHELQKSLDELRQHLETAVLALEARDVRVATTGLRKAIFGLMCNAAGLLLIGLGIVLGA